MFHKTLAMSFIAMIPSSLLLAQNDPAPRRQPQTGTTPQAPERDHQPQAGGGDKDTILASWLLVENNNEIALAQLALQKAQSNEVKQFAQKMIDEHGQFGQKLQAMVGTTAGLSTKGDQVRGDGSLSGGNRERSNRDRPTDKERDGKDVKGQTADASGMPQNATMGALDHVSLIRDLGKKCLESESKMLNEKSGAEFDRCYMQMQVCAHVKLADTIEVFRTYSSEKLRPTLDESLKTVQAHLEHAKGLCKQTCEKGDKSAKGGGEQAK